MMMTGDWSFELDFIFLLHVVFIKEENAFVSSQKCMFWQIVQKHFLILHVEVFE